MTDINDNLFEVFDSFCAFGSARNLSNVSEGPQMDGSKWAKFCRDNKLIQGQVTTTEVDIIFNKVKGKTARKIDCRNINFSCRVPEMSTLGCSTSLPCK